MENRDFKGVWIPKEIWLSKELSMTEKVILTEINSLDGENNCWSSNEYFAEFCNCGIATVTRAIKHLEELGYIVCSMKTTTTGSIRLIKMIRGVSSKRLTNNIADSNIENTILSKDNIVEKIPEVKKKSLYQKCIDEIELYTNCIGLQSVLKDYLDIRLKMTDKKLYGVNQFKGILNKLNTLANNDSDKIDIVTTAIERGWASFYPPNNKSYSKGKEVFGEDDFINCKKASKEELSGQAF